MTTETTTDALAFDHRATYCPEDNKLRFYPDWSDGDFEKEDLKAAGYRWASKQECYVCPRWTPTAEDAALDYVLEIEDETYSPAERAADRAERFAGYRDKRRAGAHSFADRMGSGSIGFQDQRKADRAARRRDRLAGHSLTQWDRAEYWQSRTAGVINNAIGKENPATRRTRIKQLEADQRKQLASLKERAERLSAWAKVATMEGGDILLPLTEEGYGITSEANEAGRMAYTLANVNCRVILPHPNSAANDYAAELHGEYHRGFSPYEMLTNKGRYGSFDGFERLTPRHVAKLYLEHVGDPSDSDDYGRRWERHYQLRLDFERAMLGEEGGAATDAEIVPGGFIFMRGEMGRWCLETAPSGWVQVQRVHKSRSTGKASSVEVWGEYGHRGETKPMLVKVDIERFGADRYRTPTAEELQAFNDSQKAAKKAKAKAKSTKPQAPQLINPTPESAELLQAMLNDLERDERTHSKTINSTQAAYSSQSKGSYSDAETISIGEKGLPMRNYYTAENDSYQRFCVFKVRTYTGGGKAKRVVIITDKPQKPLPFDLIDQKRAECPTEESHGRAFAELFNRRSEWGYEFNGFSGEERATASQLRKDFGYLGWCRIECANQCDLTTKGAEVLEKWRAVLKAETVGAGVVA